MKMSWWPKECILNLHGQVLAIMVSLRLREPPMEEKLCQEVCGC